MDKLKELSLKLHTLTVLRPILNDPVIKALCRYLDMDVSTEPSGRVDAYAEFVSLLYSSGSDSPGEYIKKLVYESDNIYVRMIGKGEDIPGEIYRSFVRDLDALTEISCTEPDVFKCNIDQICPLPSWKTYSGNLRADYIKRTESIAKYGYGIYAKYNMFQLDENGTIVPVKNPDNTKLTDLVDYKREQDIILANTRALLEGKPAANVLLTGDAGTGKSSTVKAVVNDLKQEGLRIIEVAKDRLRYLPSLMDELSENPLKFIVFTDDLSFSKDDDNFSALKAVLEGSVSAKSDNVAIYATSNRRHLVKESFSDREGDDVHFNDTVQEILSLSARFGIQITFQRPDKAKYLDIVHILSEKRGIDLAEETLDELAEQFALKKGVRSPRAARQFVDYLATGVQNVSFQK